MIERREEKGQLDERQTDRVKVPKAIIGFIFKTKMVKNKTLRLCCTKNLIMEELPGLKISIQNYFFYFG